MSEQVIQPEILKSKDKINIIVRKENLYGRYLYYPVKKEDEWLTIIHNQKSLTQDDVAYLKSTGHFHFELYREEL
tara:strand:+ start:78 stop:302 length:225 start_codon:yes stop_codon:yes gene_type:complete